MSHTTIALFRDRDHAEMAINDLKGMGVNESEISYVFVTGEGETAVQNGAGQAQTTGEAVADGAAGGATTGAVVGAIAGIAVASGILPGIGGLFVAGPLAATLGLSGAAATTAAGALTGAAAGGLIGALVGFGASDEDAHMYEDRVRKGDILVATSTDSEQVKDVFANHNAEEIREYIK